MVRTALITTVLLFMILLGGCGDDGVTLPAAKDLTGLYDVINYFENEGCGAEGERERIPDYPRISLEAGSSAGETAIEFWLCSSDQTENCDSGVMAGKFKKRGAGWLLEDPDRQFSQESDTCEVSLLSYTVDLNGDTVVIDGEMRRHSFSSTESECTDTAVVEDHRDELTCTKQYRYILRK